MVFEDILHREGNGGGTTVKTSGTNIMKPLKDYYPAEPAKSKRNIKLELDSHICGGLLTLTN